MGDRLLFDGFAGMAYTWLETSADCLCCGLCIWNIRFCVSLNQVYFGAIVIVRFTQCMQICIYMDTVLLWFGADRLYPYSPGLLHWYSGIVGCQWNNPGNMMNKSPESTWADNIYITQQSASYTMQYYINCTVSVSLMTHCSQNSRFLTAHVLDDMTCMYTLVLKASHNEERHVIALSTPSHGILYSAIDFNLNMEV